MTAKLRVLALSGSLRQASLNTALLRAAQACAPEGVEFQFESIELPLFNSDLTEPSALEPVERFKEAVANADAVLIATPEYNYSIPGPLKNAIDWASRPAYKSVFAHKPVAVLGAAASPVGSARAQGHLKQVLLGMVAQVFPAPELTLGGAARLFNDAGELTDETARQKLTRFLNQFTDWSKKQAS